MPVPKSILREAEKYRQIIYDASQTSGVFKPSLIAGIIHEESMFGILLTPRGPEGTGDHTPRNGRNPDDGLGWGRGLMQIDYASWEFARTGNWRDPMENIMFGVNLLKGLYDALRSDLRVKDNLVLPGALAAYNCGLSRARKAIYNGMDVDFYTSRDKDSGPRGDYSKDVLRNANDFIENGWN